MTCTSPINAYKTATGVVFSEQKAKGDYHQIQLPCGVCQSCRLKRAADWTIRCMHEAQLHSQNCFLTLTYGRDALPANSSLDHSDYQKFMKRLRKHANGADIRYYMCGEYGPLNGRPHYHACIFGWNFLDRTAAGKSESGQTYYTSKILDKLWPHGRATVQDLTQQSAGYCARYIMKKQMGKSAEQAYGTRTHEYAKMSLNPAIGKRWYDKNKRDVFPHDFAILNGTKMSVPKYYDKLLKDSCPEQHEEVQSKREIEGAKSRADNTPERREAKDIVLRAKIRNLKRSI